MCLIRVCAKLRLFGLILAFLSCSGVTQAALDQDGVSSCFRFAQAFYAWYVPVAETNKNVLAWDVGVQRKHDAFSTRLLRALKADSQAQAKASGEIVGIDFDPFLNTQDVGDRYELRHPIRKGDTCSVDVYRIPIAKDKAPDVVAELAERNGRWQFVNFQYPDIHNNLLDILTTQRQNRAKP